MDPKLLRASRDSDQTADTLAELSLCMANSILELTVPKVIYLVLRTDVLQQVPFAEIFISCSHKTGLVL